MLFTDVIEIPCRPGGQPAQDSQGRIDEALTTCGIVAGGINLNEFQLDGEYAMAQLLLPGQQVQLTGFGGPVGAGQAFGTAATLTGAAAQAQQTPPTGPGSPWPSLSSTPSRGTRARRPRDPAAQEAAQYDLEFSGPFSILDFIELGRASIDQADGGSANWNVGINYESVLATSPFHKGVQALYQAAGLTSALTCRT